MVEKVHALTAHTMSWQDTTVMVEQLNRMLPSSAANRVSG